MDPPTTSRRLMAVSSSSDYSVGSPTTLSGDAADENVRPSAEEWYPRLHLGWNYKECVDIYCYFTARPFHADLEIKWAIYPFGPPFGKRQPMSFDHVLQLVDMQCNSDVVKRAIAIGFSTQYHAQAKFKDNAPVYIDLEPTSEEILIAWEDHSLDTCEDSNVQKVKDAVQSMFGFDIRKDDVELLKRFSALNKVSIFETNTWRQMMCFKCCPMKEAPGSPVKLTLVEKNLRKRKNCESSEENVEPASKRIALSSPKETAPNTDLTPGSSAHEIQVTAPENTEESLLASSGADSIAKAGESPNPSERVQEASATDSATHFSVSTSTDIIRAPSFLGETHATQLDLPPKPAIAVNSALSATLTVSSWLRLLTAPSFESGSTYSTARKWLKDTFDIDASSADIMKMTELARAENISPLQTTAFRCMAVAARNDLGNILMNPRGPSGVNMARRASFRVVTGNIMSAVQKASGRLGMGTETGSMSI